MRKSEKFAPQRPCDQRKCKSNFIHLTMQSLRAAELRVLNYRMLQEPGEQKRRYIEEEGRIQTGLQVVDRND